MNDQTEQEMRDSEVPRPTSQKQLMEYISGLVERDHDYGTCVYAMSMAATAAFNYVAGKLGVTGFQASCADLDIIRRTRRMDCPFTLIDGDRMLYPQYDLHALLDEALTAWADWAKEAAKKKLTDNDPRDVSGRVWEHWKKLAGEP